jgi:hypothetical protein
VQAFLKKWVVESDFKVDGVGSRKMFQPPHWIWYCFDNYFTNVVHVLL